MARDTLFFRKANYDEIYAKEVKGGLVLEELARVLRFDIETGRKRFVERED